MPRTRYRIRSPRHPYFPTCTVIDWITLFNDPQLVRIVLDSWSFLQDQNRLGLYGYVILENHLHFIADSQSDLAQDVASFKSFTARRITEVLSEKGRKYLLDQLHWGKMPHKHDRMHQVWQEGSHPQQIADEAMLRQKLEYMHYNPVRRGYVDDPRHWRYSSARDYAGAEGLIRLKAIRGKREPGEGSD